MSEKRLARSKFYTAQRLRAWLQSRQARRHVSPVRPRMLYAETLEPRFLLSGEAMLLPPLPVVDANTPVQILQQSLAAQNALTPAAAVQQAVTAKVEVNSTGQKVNEIFFVDAQVKNASVLIGEALKPREGQNAAAQVEVVVLDSAQDGVDQISDWLQNYRGLQAIHLLSHGDAGALRLGNTTLNAQNLESFTDKLTSWRAALAPGADLLLYGCGVAQGGDGQAFINTLAHLTGSDVAASVDATGASALGGNWILEKETGTIETVNPFLSFTGYNDLMVTTTPTISGSSTLNALTFLTAKSAFTAASNLGAQLDANSELARTMPMVDLPFAGLLRTSDGRTLGDILAFRTLNGTSVLDDYKLSSGGTGTTAGLMAEMGDYLNGIGAYSTLESLANHSGSSIQLSDNNSGKITATLTLSRAFMQRFGFGDQLKALGLDFLAGSGIPLQADIHLTASYDLVAGTIAISTLDAQVKVVDPAFSAKMALGVVEATISGGTLNFDTGMIEFEAVAATGAADIKLPNQAGFSDADNLIVVKEESIPLLLANASFDLGGSIGSTPLATIAGGTPHVSVAFGGLSLTSVETNSAHPTVGGMATLHTDQSLQVTVGGVGGVGGAVYTVAPAQDGSWSLDLATATPDSGTLALGAGVSVEVVAAIIKTADGAVSTSATGSITVNPTVDDVLAHTLASKPTLTGVAFLDATQSMTVSVGGATYAVTPANDGTWSLNLQTATAQSGTLNLINNPSSPYTITVTISNGPTLTGQLTIDTAQTATIVTPPDAVTLYGDTITGSVVWSALQAAPLVATSDYFSNLQAISSLNATNVVNMLTDLGTYLELLRDSGSFDALLPFTGLSLGQALDFSAAFTNIINTQLATTVSAGMVASKAISPVLNQNLVFDLQVQRQGDERVTTIAIAIDKSETTSFTHINQLAGLIGNKISLAVDGWLAWAGDPVQVRESLEGGLAINAAGSMHSSASQTLDVHASDGVYKLTYNGLTSGAISALASPIEVQHALEKLVGEGNVFVSGRSKHYLIDFIGSKAGTDIPLLGVTDLDLSEGSLLDVTASEFSRGVDGRTWGKINILQADPDDFTVLRIAPSSGVSVQTLTGGSESSEAMQRLFVIHAGDGSFTLNGPGEPPVFSTAAISLFGKSPVQAQETIANALAAKLNAGVVGLSVVEVTNEYAADNGTRVFDIAFGKINDQYYAQGQLTADSASAGVTLSEITAGGKNQDGDDVNEVQSLTVDKTRSGSYVLKGTAASGAAFTTQALAYSASAATIQQALRDAMGLSGLTVMVNPLDANAFLVGFDAKNYALLRALNLWTSQVPAQAIVSTAQLAAAAVGSFAGANEVQELIVSNANGGSFVLGVTLDSLQYESSAIAYDASASTLKSALVAMFRQWESTLSESDFAVSKDGNTYAIAFTGQWAECDMPQLRVNSTKLTTAVGTHYSSLEFLGFLPAGQDTQVNKVTTFVTLTEMVQRFQQSINAHLSSGTFTVNPIFDVASKSFQFNVRLTPKQTIAVPLTVSSAVGNLSSLSTDTSLDLDTETLFEATIGFDFSQLNTFALRAGGTYSGSIVASASDTTLKGWSALPLIFGDAPFNISFDGESYDLTLTQAAVAANSSRNDLISDLQAVFAGQTVDAGGVLARLGFSHLGQVVTVGKNDQDQLILTVRAPVDQVQLTVSPPPSGYLANPMGAILGFRTLPCYPSPKLVTLPSNGQLIAGDAHFNLIVDQSAAIAVTLSQAATSNNTKTDDLISDLNAALSAISVSAHAYLGSAGKGFSNLGQVVQAILRNGQIELVTQSAKIASLQLEISGADPATKELGFTPGQFATTSGAYVFVKDVTLGGNYSAVVHGQSGANAATLSTPGQATLGMLDLTFEKILADYNGSLKFNLRNGLNGAAHDAISLNELFDSASSQDTLLGLGGTLSTSDSVSSSSAPFQSNGQLLRDVGLSVTVGTTLLDVVVRKSVTENNSTVADLAADINSAIHAALVAKLTTDPYAGFQFVEADSTSVSGKTVLQYNAPTTHLSLATTPTQIYNAATGVLAIDLPLTILLPNSGGFTVDVKVLASETSENTSLAQLVEQIDSAFKMALYSARTNTDSVSAKAAIDPYISSDLPTGFVSQSNGALSFLVDKVTARPITLNHFEIAGRLLKDDYLENMVLRNQAGTSNSTPTAKLTFSGIGLTTPAGVVAAGLNSSTVISIEVTNPVATLSGAEAQATTDVVPANGLGGLTPFKDLTWSAVRDDLSQLGALFGDLGAVGPFGELGQLLPILGTSFSDIFDFSSRFDAVDSALAGQNGIGLNGLAAALESAFGLSSGAVTLAYDTTLKALNINLPYQVVIDQTVPIEMIFNDSALLSLLSAADQTKLSAMVGTMKRLKDVNQSALLDLHADLTFHLALGIDMDSDSANKGHLFLYDHQEAGSSGLLDDQGTYAVVNVFHASAAGMAFTSVQGIYSLGVTGGSANLLINSGSGLTLHSDNKDGAADGRLYLNRYALLTSEQAAALRHADFAVIFDGSANVTLPMNLTVSDDLGQLAMEQIDGFINPLPLGKMELNFLHLGDSFAKMGGKSGYTLQSSSEGSSNSASIISSQVKQAALPERPATGNGSAVTTPEGAPIDSVDESGLSTINPNPYFGSTEGSGSSTTPGSQTVDITKLFATGPSVNPTGDGFDVSLIIPDFAYWQIQLTQVLNAAIGEKCDPGQVINGPLIFLLRDPTIIVETVDKILSGIQQGLDAFSSVLDLPIIGDKLREATQFVVDLRKNVVGAIKKALDEAVDVYGGLDNALRMMLFKILEPADVDHNYVVTLDEQADGNPFLNFIQDYNGDTLITPDDIVVEYLAGTGQPELDPALAEYLAVSQGGPIPAVLPGQRTAWVTSGQNTVKTDAAGNQIKHDDGSLCYVGEAGQVVLDSSLQKIVDDMCGTIDSVTETAGDILGNITNNWGNGFQESAKAFVEFIIDKVADGYDYQHLLTDVFGAGVIAATFVDVLSEFVPSSDAIAADAATVKYNVDHNLIGTPNMLIPKAVLNELKTAVQEKAEEVALEMALGSSTALQFRMHLGQTYNPELDLSFDIGVPGLSLALDGGVGLELSWDLYLGFGIDINDGFYLITNMPERAGIGEMTTYDAHGVATGTEANGKDLHIDNLWLVGKPTFTPAVKELQAQLDVYLLHGGSAANPTPAELSGKLLFLNGTLTDNWDGWIKDNDTGIWGTGTDSMGRFGDDVQNANYGRTTELFDGETGAEGSRTRLRVDFSIDLKDVGLFGISALANFTNGRLTYADFRSAKLKDLFKVEWEAKAQINLHVQLGLSLDMDGHAKDSYLPTVIGDFHLTWQDSNKSKITKQIDQFLGSGYSKLFHTGEMNIWMSDIYLDVGTFFSQFLLPVVKVIQNVTDPIMPVIDALTTPIPGLSDLMGRDYSAVDLASDMSALFGGISKVDFIIAMINLLEVIGHLPTDTDGMLLPIKEAFIISGKKDRKLNLSALSSIIPDVDVPLPYLTIADVHIKEEDFEFAIDMGVGWHQDTTLINILQGNIPSLSFDFDMSADVRIPAPYIDATPFNFTIDGIYNREGTELALFRLDIKAGWPHLMLSDILNGNLAPRFIVTLVLPDIDFTPNMLPLLRVVMPKLTATFNNVQHTLLGGGEMVIDWPSWLQPFVDKTRVKTFTGPTANINLGALPDFLMPLPYVEVTAFQFTVPGLTGQFGMKVMAGWHDMWFSDFIFGGMLPTLHFEIELPTGFDINTQILPIIKVAMPTVDLSFTISGSVKTWTINAATWTADWPSALRAFVNPNVNFVNLTVAGSYFQINLGAVDLRFLPTIRVEWPDVHWIALGKDYLWAQTSSEDLGWSGLIDDDGILSLLVDTSNAIVIKMPDIYLPSINLLDLLPDFDFSFDLPGLPSLPSINIELPSIDL
ncbi:MAG: DUF4347 domain-containing protein, partial [Magnetococcales bacterium]|nr:DUF4347 domain-containing protein [Magnetococcales bacterium]